MVMSNVRVTGKDVHVFESSGRLEREVVRGTWKSSGNNLRRAT